MNVHRWRKLEGSDPGMYELIQKAERGDAGPTRRRVHGGCTGPAGEALFGPLVIARSDWRARTDEASCFYVRKALVTSSDALVPNSFLFQIKKKSGERGGVPG